MNVLWLSPYAVHPPRHGTATRIFHLARALSVRHRVTVVSFEADWEKNLDVDGAPFDLMPLRWSPLRASRRRYWSSRFGVLPPRSPASDENVSRLRDLLDGRGIEVVIAENVHLAPLVPAIADRPLVWVPASL